MNPLFSHDSKAHSGLSNLALLAIAFVCTIVCLAGTLDMHAQTAKVLKIAAAADLQPVLPPLAAEFEGETGVKIEASYASSATLATQMLNGAPFDLFLAADLSFPQRVAAAGLAAESAPVPYARGTLVLWARHDSPVRKLKEGLSLAVLKDPALEKVSVADAAHAPYGRAAMAAIEHLGLKEQLQSKLVVAQNIAQAAQFVESGNAEIGFISLTAALTPRMQSEGSYIAVPEDAYPPILQGAVILKNSASMEAAQGFLRFLESPAIRKQLSERGLKTP
jgi:molybdate transport system substrate-binding protein